VSPSGADRSLSELADGARAAGRLALDTEFVGEGRYRTLLCLVQVAIPEGQGPGERIAILDPLEKALDASALTGVLADPAVRIVVHAGRQDVALIRRRFGGDVTNLFDTQVAAGFAGLGAQSSYDSLLSGLLGLRLAKTASFTRWDARPLSAEQIAYAREDVVHLLDLAGELERRLEPLGRLEWALEECETVAGSSDERDPETIFRRLPKINTLNAKASGVARELVLWREARAERHDRPVQSVLGDPALVELARRSPTSRGALARIRGLGGGLDGRRGQELLDVVRRGRERPPDETPALPRPPSPKPDDPPLVALAEALVRTRAREARLAYELLAARAELQAIVTSVRTGAPEPDIRTLKGWRRELVGTELLELLTGGLALSVLGGGEDMRANVERSAGVKPQEPGT
jgi:ribonuclease D